MAMSSRSRAVVLTTLLASWTVLGFACSAEDENPAPTRPRGPDGGGSSTVQTTDAAGSVSTEGLCEAYGGNTKIITIADAIIGGGSLTETDCRISRKIEDNRDDHAYGCWQVFMLSVFQCPEITFDGGVTGQKQPFSIGQTRDRKTDKACRSRLPDVELSSGDFKAFVEDVEKTFSNFGVKDEDIAKLRPQIEQAKQDLTKGDPSNDYSNCAPGCTRGPLKCEVRILDGGREGGKEGGSDAGGDAADAADGNDGAPI